MVKNKKFFVCYLLASALSAGCNIAQRNLMSGETSMDMGISPSILFTEKLKKVYKEIYDKKIKDIEAIIGHVDCITHNGTNEYIVDAKAKVVRSLSSQKKIYEAMSELDPTILIYIHILLDLEKRKHKVSENQTLDQQNGNQTQLKLPHVAYLDMQIKKVRKKLKDLQTPFVSLQLDLSELQLDLGRLKREIDGLQVAFATRQLEINKLQCELNKDKANAAHLFKLWTWFWLKIIQPIRSRRWWPGRVERVISRP